MEISKYFCLLTKFWRQNNLRDRVLPDRAWEQVALRSSLTPHPSPLFPLFLLLLLLAGCSWSPPPEFKMNTEGRDPQSVTAEERESIRRTMESLFGTPDNPLIPKGVELNRDKLAMAAGPVSSDENDNPRGLYRKHCMMCHGVSGDGAGPNAAALSPYPRDYRHGVFKFTSTAGGAKPAHEDLLRTLRKGIPATAMPSFGKLPDAQLESLVEYVEYLSLRGETELVLINLTVDEEETLDAANLDGFVEENVVPIARSWTDASQLQVHPPSPPPTDTPKQLAASLARGNEIFHSTGAQCFKCHGPQGQGDGESRPLFDAWNKKKRGNTPEETRRLSANFALPLVKTKPRNFTKDVFRGGDRPIDQYFRVSVGIKGTPMPPAGPAPGSPGILNPEEIWDVVNYVRSLHQ
jgi:mono/diheme cytochrome c family protein